MPPCKDPPDTLTRLDAKVASVRDLERELKMKRSERNALIRTAVLEEGESQEAVARRIKFSQSWISHIVRPSLH